MGQADEGKHSKGDEELVHDDSKFKLIVMQV